MPASAGRPQGKREEERGVIMKLKREFYGIIISLGHLCADLGGGALPAILPFLVKEKGITLAAAAGLTFALSSVGGIIQPVFGALADKHVRPWMMGLGVLMSGCGISMLGFLDSYWAMFLAVAFTGIGSALFHPDGGRMANYVAGERKGRGISNFSVGGNIGGAAGPILVVFGITQFGMKGTAVLAIPAFLMALFLFSQTKQLTAFAQEGNRNNAAAIAAGQTDDWKNFSKLTAVVILRSIVNMGMTTFIPLFWLNVLMQPAEISSITTTIISIAGAVSTLIGGRLADRFGFNRVIRTGLVCFIPCLAIVILCRIPMLSTVMLVPMAMFLYLAFSPCVALGQKLLPNHVGLASGITMGLASSFGGVASPLLGKLGDAQGVPTVMWVLVGITVLACIGSFAVPNGPQAHQPVVKKEASQKV